MAAAAVAAVITTDAAVALGNQLLATADLAPPPTYPNQQHARHRVRFLRHVGPYVTAPASQMPRRRAWHDGSRTTSMRQAGRPAAGVSER